MSKSKTKSQLAAELKKLRVAYKKKAPAARRTYAKKAPRRSASSNIGADIGEMIGGKPGRALGSLVSRGASALYRKITGHGDYKVTSNTLMNGNDPPSFGKSGRGMIVRHREYLTDITGSTTFSLYTFPLNPGLPTTFPWLSRVAQNYEEYVIRGMIFEFKSTSANALNSTNTALGTVVMATRYNCLLPSFASKIEMENYEFCTATKPSESAIHPIECAVGESPLSVLYTRGSEISPSTGSDLRMYDMGNFQIATVGMQASAVIGELWVSYDIELLKPRIQAQYTAGYEGDHWKMDQTGYALNNPFGNAPLLRALSANFGSTVIGGTGNNRIILPDWSSDYYFMIVAQWTGATPTAIAAAGSLTFGSNVAYAGNFWQNNSVPYACTPNSTTAGILYEGTFKFTANSGSRNESNRTIYWQAQTAITGYAGGDMWITGIPQPSATLDESKTPLLSHESKEEKKELKEPCFAPIASDDEIDDEDAASYAEFIKHKKKKDLLPVDPPSGRDESAPSPHPSRSKSIK